MTGGADVGVELSRGLLAESEEIEDDLELEGLSMGIAGKIELWRMLSTLRLDERAGVDFDALAERGEDQRMAITELHRIAAAAIDGSRDEVAR